MHQTNAMLKQTIVDYFRPSGFFFTCGQSRLYSAFSAIRLLWAALAQVWTCHLGIHWTHSAYHGLYDTKFCDCVNTFCVASLYERRFTYSRGEACVEHVLESSSDILPVTMVASALTAQKHAAMHDPGQVILNTKATVGTGRLRLNSPERALHKVDCNCTLLMATASSFLGLRIC